MCERLKKGIRTMAPAFIIRLFFVCFFSAVSVHKILWLCCRIFSVLSAILYLGNITYRSKSTGRDEGLDVGPPEILATLSDLLKVAPFFVSMWHGASLCLTGCLRQLALICMGFFFFFSGQRGAAGRSTDEEENSDSKWQADPPIQSIWGRHTPQRHLCNL